MFRVGLKPRVILGMSGGIDSSVSAHLLRQMGYEVIGVVLKTAYVDEKAVEKAESVASALSTKLIIKDLSSDFENFVVNPFIDAYEKGLTPNPCVVCNPEFKFSALLRIAQEKGADFIATGHYARVVEAKGKKLIARPASGSNDQSYFLYRLTQEIRNVLILPLGEMSKVDVRRTACEIGLDYSGIRGSQEACFMDGDIRCWIEKMRPGIIKPGPAFELSSGKFLGTHSGSVSLTLGQRKGHGVCAGKRAYVAKIDHKSNSVFLGNREDCLVSGVSTSDAVLLSECEVELAGGMRLEVRTRSSMDPVPAVVRLKDGKLTADFENSVWASAPGQSMVCYDADVIVCGGLIA